MVKSKGKKAIKEFVNHIDHLGLGASDRLVMRFRGDETEKAFLNRIIADTRLLMENNEYVVGLENLISNLYEVEFKIDEKGIQLVKESIKSCGLDYNDWRFVEELKK